MVGFAFRQRDELRRFAGLQIERRLDRLCYGFVLDGLDLKVGARHLEQQHGGGKLVAMLGRLRRLALAKRF